MQLKKCKYKRQRGVTLSAAEVDMSEPHNKGTALKCTPGNIRLRALLTFYLSVIDDTAAV